MWCEAGILFLTAAAVDGIPACEPAKRFACQDTIYAVAQDTYGADTMHVAWITPSGKVETAKELDIGGARWAFSRFWLTGGSLNPVESGLSHFAGEWTLRVQLGEKLIIRQFELLC